MAFTQNISIENLSYDHIVEKMELMFDTNFDSECTNIEFDFGVNIRVENLEIFNRSSSSFPFERGAIFSTGHAQSAIGPNTEINTSTGSEEFGSHFDIMEIMDHRIGNLGTYPESKSIHLLVEPSSDIFRFRYIFASESYQNGTIECFNGTNEFQDGFAIIIKGPGIIPDTYDHDNDVTTPEIEFNHGGKNLALLPNGITEAGLHSIHQNTACSNVGFSQFYEEIPLETGAISFNGMSTPLVAETSVISGEAYELYIIIANRGNSLLDSALFIEFPFNPGIPNLEENYILCLDENGEPTDPVAIIDTEIEDPFYTFKWYFSNTLIVNETQNFIVPQQAGDYSVEIIGPSGCSNFYSTTVIASSAPFNLNYEVSGVPFSNEQNLSIFVDGFGDYMYQLNNSEPQASSVFSNLGPGEYQIRVTDQNGCGFIETIVMLIDYPRFFTPNNDGYFDSWNVNLSELGRTGTISIFDRYGKLLKVISSEGNGWDGTFNGKPLPSNDYWFKIDFSNGETFTAHFTLKR